MMIKKMFAVMVLSLFFLVPFSVCQAEDYGAGKVAGVAKIGSTVAGESSVEGLIGKVISLALSFVGIVFFILILYAGVTWMTAMGNTEATTKSKNIIEAAVIGLVLVSAAYAISSFVFSKIGSSSSGGGSGSETATCQKEGDKCGNDNNLKCDAGLSCKSLCEIEFANNDGHCMDIAQCDTAPSTDVPPIQYEYVTGKCPGASSNICCKAI